MTEDQLRVGIVAVLSNDGTVQTLCARATDVVVPRTMATEAPALPILVYDVPTFDEAAETAELRLSALAMGETAGTITRALREAAKAALTQPAFESHGLQVAPLKAVDVGVQEGDQLGTPDVHQADASIQLLVFES